MSYYLTKGMRIHIPTTNHFDYNDVTTFITVAKAREINQDFLYITRYDEDNGNIYINYKYPRQRSDCSSNIIKVEDVIPYIQPGYLVKVCDGIPADKDYAALKGCTYPVGSMYLDDDMNPVWGVHNYYVPEEYLTIVKEIKRYEIGDKVRVKQIIPLDELNYDVPQMFSSTYLNIISYAGKIGTVEYMNSSWASVRFSDSRQLNINLSLLEETDDTTVELNTIQGDVLNIEGEIEVGKRLKTTTGSTHKISTLAEPLDYYCDIYVPQVSDDLTFTFSKDETGFLIIHSNLATMRRGTVERTFYQCYSPEDAGRILRVIDDINAAKASFKEELDYYATIEAESDRILDTNIISLVAERERIRAAREAEERLLLVTGIWKHHDKGGSI